MIIPPFMLGFIERYAVKIGVGLLATILFTGTYFYHRHKIYAAGKEDGRQETEALWQQREAKIKKAADKLIAKKERERQQAIDENHELYKGAIKRYAQHAQDVTDQLNTLRTHRLLIRTKPTACNRDSLPTDSGNTGGIGGTGSEVYEFAELDDGVRADLARFQQKIELGRLDCQEIIENYVTKYFRIQ